MKKGIPAQKWLEEVTLDQNLEKLDQATTNAIDNLRRWFVSRIIQPVYRQGRYRAYTKKITLRTLDLTDMENIEIVENDTSVGSADLGPFAYDILLYYLGVQSDRGPLWTVELTDGTTTINLPGTAGTATANICYSLIPGTAISGAGVAAGMVPSPLFIPAGWTLTTVEGNFVAADATVRWYIYARV